MKFSEVLRCKFYFPWNHINSLNTKWIIIAAKNNERMVIKFESNYLKPLLCYIYTKYFLIKTSTYNKNTKKVNP